MQTKKKDPQKTLANLVKRHRALDERVKVLQENPPKSADPNWVEELKKLKTKKCELKTRIQQMSKQLGDTTMFSDVVSELSESSIEDDVGESGDYEQEAA